MGQYNILQAVNKVLPRLIWQKCNERKNDHQMPAFQNSYNSDLEPEPGTCCLFMSQSAIIARCGTVLCGTHSCYIATLDTIGPVVARKYSNFRLI